MTAFNSKLNKTQLIAEGKRLEAALTQLRNAPPKTVVETIVQNAPQSPEVHALDIEALTVSLQALQGNVGDAIGTYQTDLTAEMSEVLSLRGQLDRELAELLELHNIEPDGSTTLGKLINEYNTTSNDIRIAASVLANEIEDATLEATSLWNQEQDLYEEKLAEQRGERATAIQRDADEYSYVQQKARTADELADQEAARIFTQDMNTLATESRVELRARIDEIEAKEASHSEVRTLVMNLREELAGTIRRAEGEGTGIANRQVAHKVAMTEAENSAEVNSQRIDHAAKLSEQNDNAHAIARLTARLESLTTSNQQLAQQALEARHKGSTQALEVAERIALASAQGGKK